MNLSSAAVVTVTACAVTAWLGRSTLASASPPTDSH